MGIIISIIVGGIIGWIRNAFSQRELGFASIKGHKNRQAESFTTEKLGKRTFLNIETDDRGQVVAEDVWEQLASMMDNLD